MPQKSQLPQGLLVPWTGTHGSLLLLGRASSTKDVSEARLQYMNKLETSFEMRRAQKRSESHLRE